MLEIKELYYEISGKEILKKINLKFEKGKFYGIIGPNGSGKSTLLDLIVGYKEKKSGTISVDQKLRESYSTLEYAKKVALVPQEFDTHFNYTSKEIIEMGRYPYESGKKGDSQGDEIIKEFVKNFAVENLMDKGILEMSGGERQRILFIKALVQNTDYILLDEATSALDPYNTHAFMNEIVREVKKKDKCAIAVIHDMNLASLYCDYIVMLKEGEVLAVDESDTVLKEENINRLFNVQSEIIEVKGKKIIFPYLNDN